MNDNILYHALATPLSHPTARPQDHVRRACVVVGKTHQEDNDECQLHTQKLWQAVKALIGPGHIQNASTPQAVLLVLLDPRMAFPSDPDAQTLFDRSIKRLTSSQPTGDEGTIEATTRTLSDDEDGGLPRISSACSAVQRSWRIYRSGFRTRSDRDCADPAGHRNPHHVGRHNDGAGPCECVRQLRGEFVGGKGGAYRDYLT